MKIGSHVSMAAPMYLVGAVQQTIAYGGNAMMIYTGPPQNTRRKEIGEMQVEEALTLMHEHHISSDSLIVHAPYIINLANCTKPETFTLAHEFLAKEIARVQAIGARILVLHPGSHVQAGEEAGLASIVAGLDLAMRDIGDVQIALETMSGKGSELGYRFEQLRYIIDHVAKPDHIRVCLDTCHIHDAGYDIHKFDQVLDEFNRILGIERLVCMHINDSKNVQGAKKDRHENLGFGEIGFATLCEIVHHPRVAHVVKILETPFVDGHAPYKQEIAMLKSKQFDPNIVEKIKQE